MGCAETRRGNETAAVESIFDPLCRHFYRVRTYTGCSGAWSCPKRARKANMEITSHRFDDFNKVRAKCRSDGYWSDHLPKALEEIVRQGNHRIRVNICEVDYITSLGIRVLVLFYQKLSSIRGGRLVSRWIATRRIDYNLNCAPVGIGASPGILASSVSLELRIVKAKIIDEVVAYHHRPSLC
jgi:hypothetical protein